MYVVKKLVTTTLRSLGVTPCYRGFSAIVFSVMLVAEDESRLDNAMRDIYAAVATELNSDARNVERNIRTLVHRAWQVDKTRLSAMAGYKLDGPPSSLQFIEIMASYVCRSI